MAGLPSQKMFFLSKTDQSQVYVTACNKKGKIIIYEPFQKLVKFKSHEKDRVYLQVSLEINPPKKQMPFKDDKSGQGCLVCAKKNLKSRHVDTCNFVETKTSNYNIARNGREKVAYPKTRLVTTNFGQSSKSQVSVELPKGFSVYLHGIYRLVFVV